jgi:hypothetical protein
VGVVGVDDHVQQRGMEAAGGVRMPVCFGCRQGARFPAKQEQQRASGHAPELREEGEAGEGRRGHLTMSESTMFVVRVRKLQLVISTTWRGFWFGKRGGRRRGSRGLYSRSAWRGV